MSLSLDHVVIAVYELKTAMVDFEGVGFTVRYGGEHASGSTHNALICFRDGTYLELLAPTGKPARPGTVDFSSMLQMGEGIVAYALASDQLEEDAEAIRKRGIPVGDVQEGGRRREDGVELHWKTALINGAMQPFIIQDITPRSLRVPDDGETTAHANGVRGIHGLVISGGEIGVTAGWLERLLGVKVQGLTPQRSTFSLGTSSIILTSTAEDTEQPYKLWLETDEAMQLDQPKTHGAVLITKEEEV